MNKLTKFIAILSIVICSMSVNAKSIPEDILAEWAITDYSEPSDTVIKLFDEWLADGNELSRVGYTYLAEAKLFAQGSLTYSDAPEYLTRLSNTEASRKRAIARIFIDKAVLNPTITKSLSSSKQFHMTVIEPELFNACGLTNYLNSIHPIGEPLQQCKMANFDARPIAKMMEFYALTHVLVR